jgi:hypothetical protein
MTDEPRLEAHRTRIPRTNFTPCQESWDSGSEVISNRWRDIRKKTGEVETKSGRHFAEAKTEVASSVVIVCSLKYYRVASADIAPHRARKLCFCVAELRTRLCVVLSAPSIKRRH